MNYIKISFDYFKLIIALKLYKARFIILAILLFSFFVYSGFDQVFYQLLTVSSFLSFAANSIKLKRNFHLILNQVQMFKNAKVSIHDFAIIPKLNFFNL
jgi:hypothetical protein